jgi:uncharacterized membrane protein YphA (DoxX/SURF4 family)
MAEFWLITVGLILGRLLVGGMLVLAGVLKLKAGSRWFLQQILAYELVKGRVAWLLARGLSWAEVVCGVLLIVGLLTPLVAVVSFALLWGFTVAVVSTFLRGKPVDCGCFGRVANPQAQKARWTVAYRNLTLMALLIVVYSFAPVLAVDNWLSGWLYQLSPDTRPQAALAVLWLISLFSVPVIHWWIQGRGLIKSVPAQQGQ